MKLLIISAAVLMAASQLGAQATRTWVSGVGDDANPCSRTAPCKTFQGAISKTAAGGEINAIDPGGYGPVSITKSLTIDGTGTMAGVLSTNANGIIVNAGPTDIVVLRRLALDGTGTLASTDTRGVKFIAGKTLVIDDCKIENFTKRNISIESSTNGAQAFVSNTMVSGGLNNGIILSPPLGVSNQLVLDHVQVVSNAFYGVGVTGGILQVYNSNISNNAGGGLLAAGASAVVDSTMITGNPIGIESQSGAAVTISKTTVVGNATGLDFPSGTIVSMGNNLIAGNGSGNGPATSTAAMQ